MTVTDPLGRVTSNVYDGLGQLVKVIDQMGNVTKTTYDVVGRAVDVKGPDVADPQAPCHRDVIRELEREDKSAVGRRLIKVPGHTCSISVTNRDEDPATLWRDYNQRAWIEQRIEELKSDLAADGFCMRKFCATEAAFLSTSGDAREHGFPGRSHPGQSSASASARHRPKLGRQREAQTFDDFGIRF